MERSKKWILIIRMSNDESSRMHIFSHLLGCSFYHLGNDVFISDTADATVTYACAFHIEKEYGDFVSSIIPIYGEVNSDTIDSISSKAVQL